MDKNHIITFILGAAAGFGIFYLIYKKPGSNAKAYVNDRSNLIQPINNNQNV